LEQSACEIQPQGRAIIVIIIIMYLFAQGSNKKIHLKN